MSEPGTDPAFEEALNEYIAALVEEQKKEYRPGLEPFSAQANKIRENITKSMRAFHDSYAKGYGLILKELETIAPETDLSSLELSDEALEILDDPEALTNYLGQGGQLYELLGFSDELMTKFYTAAYHLMEEQKIVEAKDAFFFLTTIAPALGPCWLSLGYCYEECGEHDKAIEACRKAIELSPEDPEAYLTLAHFYIEMKQLDEASGLLDQGLALALQNRGQEWAETLGSILEEAKLHIPPHGHT